MQQPQNFSQERVRKSTPTSVNVQLDQKAKENLRKYAQATPQAIDDRIAALNKEWDVERTLELNASVLALTGSVLAVLVNKRWLAVPIIVTGFLVQHAVQGWCPPLPLFRKMGIRTRQEIDREKVALKAARGDFKQAQHNPEKAWQAATQ